MQVQELITELRKMPQHKEVNLLVSGPTGTDVYGLAEGVKVDDDGDVVIHEEGY